MFMVKFGRTVLNVGLWFFSISHFFWDTLYIHLCREKARATDFCENSWPRLTLEPEADGIIIVRFVQFQCLISATESQDTPCMIKCSGSASRRGKLTCGKPDQIFSFKNQEPKQDNSFCRTLSYLFNLTYRLLIEIHLVIFLTALWPLLKARSMLPALFRVAMNVLVSALLIQSLIWFFQYCYQSSHFLQ